MRTAADWADWWDLQHKESREYFLQFAADNPNLIGIVASAAANTVLDLAAGTVDLLRFGKGIAEGGVKGYAQDTLRLIGLLGPLGKAGQLVQRGVNTRLARVISDPGGPICAWVSGTKALRQTGTRAFAEVGDLARALNMGSGYTPVGSLAQVAASLRQLGAHVGPVKNVSNFMEVAKMVPRNGSVVMFVVKGTKEAVIRGQTTHVLERHAAYAFRDLLGRIRIMERSEVGQGGPVFSSYAEFTKHWTKVDLRGGWGLDEAVEIANVFGKITDTAYKTGAITMEVLALAGKDKSERETIAQAFEVYKAAKNGVMRAGVVRNGVMLAHPVKVKNPGTPYTTVNGDTLERIAKKFYGKESKWPVIYTANRDVIGDDPNVLRVNQNLVVPELPQVRGIK